LITNIEAETSAAAWIKCVQTFLESRTTSRFNLVVGIGNPVALSPSDEAVCRMVDSFLRSKTLQPLITVANTIFPGGFYRDGGAQAVYDEFPKSYEETKSGWGTYAGRIFADKIPMTNGKCSRMERLVGKLRDRGRSPMRASYEADVADTISDEDLSTYCPSTDAGLSIGQPCLVHLSFKLHKDRTVSLTAIYRSQYYIAKALGNFIGLGQLLAFVAEEAGLTPGYLVCHATLAVLDLKYEKKTKWTTGDLSELLEHCKLAASAEKFEETAALSLQNDDCACAGLKMAHAQHNLQGARQQ
jgi:hypothetical protein